MSEEDSAGPSEEGLDPPDWEKLRTLAYRMVDDVIALHSKIGDRPAWQAPPPEVRERLTESPPAEGRGLEAVRERYLRDVEPYPFGNIHPRAWGWVNGTGSTVGALAELLAAALDTNAWGGDQASVYMERGVVRWAAEVMGLPTTTSGIVVSGGSTANLIALAAARDRQAGEPDGPVRERGLRDLERQPVFYASAEVHNSVDKAAALLGVGRDYLRKIPVDDEYRMDPAALEEALRADREAGLCPVCVIGTAGTVNTGAFDPLDRLADICDREGLWLHVDGAFGAVAALSPDLRPLLRGLERADSVAFDFHKWLHVPYGAGCVLVRDPEDHRRPFTTPAAYLQGLDRGIVGGGIDFSRLGPELSRPFRALKVWFPLQAFGVDLHRRLVEQNVRQARTLASLVEEHPRLALAAPVPLNVVCFRFVAPSASDDEANRTNREILMRLQESGVAAPSSTILRGAFVLRAAITNHRTRRDDLVTLVEEVARIGEDHG